MTADTPDPRLLDDWDPAAEYPLHVRLQEDTPDPRPVSPPSELTATCLWCGVRLVPEDGTWTGPDGTWDYCPEGLAVGATGTSPHLPVLDAARAAPQADAGPLREALANWTPQHSSACAAQDDDEECICGTSAVYHAALTLIVDEYNRAASSPATAGREE